MGNSGAVLCLAVPLLAGATCYYGDSPEDAVAAQAAGVPFVQVERFE